MPQVCCLGFFGYFLASSSLNSISLSGSNGEMNLSRAAGRDGNTNVEYTVVLVFFILFTPQFLCNSIVFSLWCLLKLLNWKNILNFKIFYSSIPVRSAELYLLMLHNCLLWQWMASLQYSRLFEESFHPPHEIPFLNFPSIVCCCVKSRAVKHKCQRLPIAELHVRVDMLTRFPHQGVHTDRGTRRQGKALSSPWKTSTRALWGAVHAVPPLSCFVILPARTTTFNRRSPVTSDLEVVAGSSSTVPLSGAFFYSHRAAFIGVLYRPLCSDVLPTLLRVDKK